MRCLLLLAALATSVHAQQPPGPRAFKLTGDTEYTHDPSIIKAGDTWYLFATGSGPLRHGELPIRCSKDLHQWAACGYVFDEIPAWIKKESPATRELWAPDISFFRGEFHLYYAFSIFGKNTSGIALATNKTLDRASPDFAWVDRGLVLRSQKEDDFNAIDPNLIIDTQGRAWLAFGSFWSGIKMRRIDPQTGKLFAADTTLYSIAARERPANVSTPPGLPADWQAIEAPFIVHHAGYYYLFVSFDLCCRGTRSTYRTLVGRSRKVTGQYIDGAGKPMIEGGGTPLLVGNARWVGPGGESILMQKKEDIIVFHAYDGTTGHPYLQISTIGWENGWPHASLPKD